MALKPTNLVGSIYDTLYVARMSREARANAGKSFQEVINIFDASQPRNNQQTSFVRTSVANIGSALSQGRNDPK